MLQHIDDVDVVVIGEGERTVVELAEAVESGEDLERVKGIIFRKNGSIAALSGQASGAH